VGNVLSDILFGFFGLTAYIAPVVTFVAVAFYEANKGNTAANVKIVAGLVLFLMIGIVAHLLLPAEASMGRYELSVLYDDAKNFRRGGGIVAGSLSSLLSYLMGTVGTVIVVILITAISLILLTHKSLLRGLKKGGMALRERSAADKTQLKAVTMQGLTEETIEEENQDPSRMVAPSLMQSLRMRQEDSREKREANRERKEKQRQEKLEERETTKILRMQRRVSGVMADTALDPAQQEWHRHDIHEVTYEEEPRGASLTSQEIEEEMNPAAFSHAIVTIPMDEELQTDEAWEADYNSANQDFTDQPLLEPHATDKRLFDVGETKLDPPNRNTTPRTIDRNSLEHNQGSGNTPDRSATNPTQQSAIAAKPFPKKYIFPPLSKLIAPERKSKDSSRELKETAIRLQQILATFGVHVTVTDVSQGPSVTRYELQPEQGVKVSRIVSLTDDIKLNLAATDIRMEAPIPGKAAIGIEVPNKENTTVALRELLSSKEFREFPSNLTFAVGRDISGKIVVADIARMPHMLIAGATGSGKSVCINTLIMSILYKAHPDEVKLIMVDPKVVELSVYNGIPHLLIPVVTDPKKAAAALHWGVSEMTDRYKKFADYNVRDLKGYNQRVETLIEQGKGEGLDKLPQIVIIVDELADLMMVSPGEVEESICRLAQLARAAGIHLIIATQRPSVDVITGLIKANMPSRVAFAVSSGVDSRTILDMNGAEKLLGKGDMLFYPQGYSKPARIQGAFVSDKEVSDVVDFLKDQTQGPSYAGDVEDRIMNLGSIQSQNTEDSAMDEYFAEAGRFIIDKEKASIGMLQRVFKIGFNRAARIMDQLCLYGVVGEEEGTKPRKILMNSLQFEDLLKQL
jgi:S-DNA-T family DNA segregation ATPase FtsK/SpoIIIE